MDRTTRARLVLAALLALSIPAAAAAVNFPVTKTADTADGTCDADCSLREAIIAANALAGPDTITVPAGTYILTIPGVTGEDASANGDLDIGSGGLTITGAGAATTIIDGGGTIRVFEVVGSGAVNFVGLTIRNGLGSFGGGIENDNAGATVSIDQCQILNNAATSSGGGVNNNVNGTINITNSLIQGNDALNFGGGVNNNSGGTMTIATSVIANNEAEHGGGVNNNSSGSLTMTDTTVSEFNLAFGISFPGGGGVLNNSSGPMTIIESTISGNHARGPGGGITNNSGGPMTVTNSTISSNSTEHSNGGGGIYKNSSGTVTLTNVTVIDNSAPGTSGGGLRNNSPSTALNVLRSIVATIFFSGGDCSGTITSLGNNLSSDATCNFVAAGDLPNTNPLVAPLFSNGGPTQTHALQAGSPAINAGGPGCPPPATDQRGITRPQGAACEIGSFECQLNECAGVGPTPTVTPTGVAPTATPTVPAPTATATPTVPSGQPVNVPTLSWPLLLVLAVSLASAGYLLSRRA